jgi:hypothetical protein
MDKDSKRIILCDVYLNLVDYYSGHPWNIHFNLDGHENDGSEINIFDTSTYTINFLRLLRTAVYDKLINDSLILNLVHTEELPNLLIAANIIYNEYLNNETK